MSPLSGFLARNWTLKLAAFGVALLLWIAVRAEAPNRQEFPGIPISVNVTDPRWALVGEPQPSTVTVRLGGPSRELIGVAVARPSVVVPIEAVASADTSVFLRNAWVSLQDRPGVVVEGIEPAAIRLTLEPVESVTLPPAIRLNGQLPEAFAMSAPPISDPSGIRVTGPRSRIADLDSIPLRPVDLSRVSGSGSFAAAVDTIGLSGMSTNVASVSVEILVEDRVERVVSGIPILLPQALRETEGVEIRPASGSVIVRGARSLVDQADPARLRLVARLEAADLPEPGDEGEFPLALEGLPALVQGEPQLSVVTLSRVASDGDR